MQIKLRDFPLTELPRERLEKFGVSSLSNFELLAILLRSGGPDLNALQLSQYLLSEFGGLSKLLAADIEQLKTYKYLGEAKATTLKAVEEIAKRILSVEEIKKPKIETPQNVHDLLLPYILGKSKECLYLLNLDVHNRLIKLSLLSIGTLTQTLADTREILKTALLKGALSIVIVHNHPSGDVQPSKEDIQLTNELAQASVYVGLNFLDHIIVSPTNFYSFKVSGLISSSKRKEVKK